MGMDIFFRDGDFRCSTRYWVECLTLAEVFGWKPEGSEAPATCHPGDPYRNWNGNCWTKEYQEVTTDDARAFGAALRRGIEAVMMELPLTVEQTQAIKVFEQTKMDYDSPQCIEIKTIGVARIAELAALASEGSFMIA